MAQAERTPSFLHLPVWEKTSCFGYLRVLFFALFHIAQANKQAFIQSDTILEVLHFGEGGLLQVRHCFLTLLLATRDRHMILPIFIYFTFI
uniref:Uncharacterized protein n=1 Tax=Hucho hucho TaxID=62062 RepID=A0A4W5K9T1_9TELE